ncbi:MAG: hypothetical protein WBP64_17950 [Nitrososphaeraceae archaeon]
MTFKELKERVRLETTVTTCQRRLFERLRNKPFCVWNTKEHIQQGIIAKGDCCLNHVIGLPSKETIHKPLFDYQQKLYDTLLIANINNSFKHDFKHKHLWTKKATGLGITEFFHRLMVWLCLRDNTYRNSQMCIVTGPNQENGKNLF